MKPTVLFTEKKSVYLLLKCDCWDEKRNALNFKKKQPVIAHPPCRLFSRLRKFSKAPTKEKELAYFSVEHIKKFGGILEHPAQSTLWKEKKLPYPGEPGQETFFSISIDQHWFGHKCKKNTWLLISGITINELPTLPLNFDAVERVISTTKKNGLKEIGKNHRNHTPVEMAKWLIKVLKIIQKNQGKSSVLTQTFA